MTEQEITYFNAFEKLKEYAQLEEEWEDSGFKYFEYKGKRYEYNQCKILLYNLRKEALTVANSL